MGLGGDAWLVALAESLRDFTAESDSGSARSPACLPRETTENTGYLLYPIHIYWIQKVAYRCRDTIGKTKIEKR